jgi:DNA-binding GntR family transcriptional regulator
MGSVLTAASLTDIAAERIREAVMRGDFGLGEKISEASLAAALRMSKTPVREALVRLSNEGLVVIQPRRGTFVFRLTREEMVEISGFRFALESSALRLSFHRDRKALIRVLTDAVAAMTAARRRGDLRAYGKADADFHCGIISGCDNRYLVEAYQRISARVAAIRTHMTPRPRMTDTAFAEHHRLVRLLQSGRLQGAIDLLQRHIDRNARYYVRESLDPSEQPRAAQLRRKLGLTGREARRAQALTPA